MRRYRHRDWKDPFSWFSWAQQGRPNVLFKYQPAGASIGAATPTFTRADASTCATYVDSNGVVQTVAANVLRNSHYIGGVRTTLLEGSRTNICLRSGALNNATWVKFGAPTVTDNFVQSGALNLSRVQGTPGTDGASQAITFTGDGVKSYLVFAKANGVNGTHNWQLRDNTAPAVRSDLSLTVAGSVVSASCSTGTLLKTVTLGGGIYCFLVQTTSVTAANAHSLKFGPNAGTCTDIVMGAVQVENAAFPSSYIATAGSAVTRAADSLSFPFLPVPQSMTVYVKGSVLDDMTGVPFSICNAAAASARTLITTSGGKFRSYHQSSAGIVTSTAAAAPAYADTVELRHLLGADGSVNLGQSINGAAEAVAGASVANALDASWSGQTLFAANLGTTQADFVALQKLVIASGVQSLATMRAL